MPRSYPHRATIKTEKQEINEVVAPDRDITIAALNDMESAILECVRMGYDAKTTQRWLLSLVGTLKNKLGEPAISPDNFDKLFKD